jgi:hypothetical protein
MDKKQQMALDDLKEINAWLKRGHKLTPDMVVRVQADMAAIQGTTLIMTLPSGMNVVRFMVPSAPVTSSGSVGKFSEGTDKNLSTAMATALAGLNA